MSKNHLLDRIKRLKKITPSESRIAEFFTEHYAEMAFENVTTLSQKTGVSKATVVRFIARLGYKDFPGFKDELRKETIATKETLSQLNTPPNDDSQDFENDFLTGNIAGIIKNLEDTLRLIDKESFMKVAKRLTSTKGRLYITGNRVSYSLAHLFYLLMVRIRPKTTLLGQYNSILPEDLLEINEHDTLFVIIRHPYSRITQMITKQCHRQKANIILISDSNYTPITGFASVQITIISKGAFNFRNFSPLAAFLDVLYAACLKFCGQETYERLVKIKELYNDFDLFSPGKTMESDQMDALKELTKGMRINDP